MRADGHEEPPIVAAIAVASIALASAEVGLDNVAHTFTLANTGWALMIVTAFAE